MTDEFLIFAGICLIGSSSAILMDLYFRLRKIGISTGSWILIDAVPREYLRLRRKHGWSAWPAYAYWPLLATGVALLALGAFGL
jgi:hypothetical protein